MKARSWLLLLMLLTGLAPALPGAVPVPAKADSGRFTVGLETAGILQYFHQDNDLHSFEQIPPGIQSAVGNVMIHAALTDGIRVTFELYLSSRHREGYVTPREGYIYLSHLPEGANVFGINRLFRYIDLKAGHFEVDFGNYHLFRSDNGQVQRNPLIGNYIIDANTVEPGVEVIVHPGAVYGVLGISNGTTTGNFQPRRGTAVHTKLGLDLHRTFQASLSLYRVDHSGNSASGCEQCQVDFSNGQEGEEGSFSSLFAANRSGSRYAGIFDGGPDVGQLNVGHGQDLLAWQADLTYQRDPVRIFAMYGSTADRDYNGSAAGTPSDIWRYYGAGVRWNLLPALYAAGRYNTARAVSIKGQDSRALVNGYQAGLGYWLTSGMLWKLEYVHQQYLNFRTDYGNIPFIQNNPRFTGVLTEISVAF